MAKVRFWMDEDRLKEHIEDLKAVSPLGNTPNIDQLHEWITVMHNFLVDLIRDEGDF